MTKSHQPRHAAGRTGDPLHAALVYGSDDALEGCGARSFVPAEAARRTQS
jgi:hypothetical protein